MKEVEYFERDCYS